jgi:cytidine deaminase
MTKATDAELTLLASNARENAHAPHSNYSVGAALRCADGTIFLGCNVENFVLGLTCCAEMVALFSAVAAGHTKFSEIAVFTISSPPAAPCGSCRQLLYSWSIPRVIMGNDQGELETTTLSALLPKAFIP